MLNKRTHRESMLKNQPKTNILREFQSIADIQERTGAPVADIIRELQDLDDTGLLVRKWGGRNMLYRSTGFAI